MAVAVDEVVQALNVMKGSGTGERKTQAHRFLEEYQKAPEAWNSTNAILASDDASAETKIFAATTLKGKIIYDLDQIPRSTLPSLRTTLLTLMKTYANGPKPIRTLLCVCLANLAVQMTEWKDVLSSVASALGPAAGDCVLDFLRVLPEEITEGRKINLSEEELDARTAELLTDNADQVLEMLVRYAGMSENAATNPHLLDCISSWLREIPSQKVIHSPLLDAVVHATSKEDSFDAAVECICTIYRDTQEVDESLEAIQVLYPKIMSLRPRIAQSAAAGDYETFKGLTRIFAEAGEAWVILIARLPLEFRALVEAILECCTKDHERDASSLTFRFWFEFKQLITLENYTQARKTFTDIWSRLVDVMIGHLQFPKPESGDESDLFEGDREQEEKFREFRHVMGDVLKDCCEVLTPQDCLAKVYEALEQWLKSHSTIASSGQVVDWQGLEAPLFAMRGMGKMVSSSEQKVLSRLIPLVLQLPEHPKIRFQATMALCRYTEWTAQHPDYLQPQLQYLLQGFEHPSTEVVMAAALAFRFVGTDCATLLQDQILHLHPFYEQILDKLPAQSQEEFTEGVSCVVGAQPTTKIYPAMKLYCDPILTRIKARAIKAKTNVGNKQAILATSDTIQLLTVFLHNVVPYYEPPQQHQAVQYCQEVLPVLADLSENFTDTVPILERICRCWRTMVFSYRTAVLPLLPALAAQLSQGFEKSRQGCFLWATDAVLKEFSVGADEVTPETSLAIYSFFEQQAFSFLRILNDLPPRDLPDVIEDFFRLLGDALLYYHSQLIPAAICSPILTASISALSLEQERPVTATLHFLRDLLSYGTDSPNVSLTSDQQSLSQSIPNAASPAQIKSRVRDLIINQGSDLIQSILRGMMFTFPRDCLQDASGTMLGIFQLLPDQAVEWVKGTLELLPPGSVRAGEAEKLLGNIVSRVKENDLRKIRTLLHDFTASYRRRNVMPREGLGRLEAREFRFAG